MSPWGHVHKRPALLAERFDLVGDLMIRLGRRRIGIKHGERLARIGLRHHIRIERNPPEERDAHVVRRGLPAPFAEDLDVLMTVRALETAHVLDNADDRHFAVLAKRDRLS